MKIPSLLLLTLFPLSARAAAARPWFAPGDFSLLQQAGDLSLQDRLYRLAYKTGKLNAEAAEQARAAERVAIVVDILAREPEGAKRVLAHLSSMREEARDAVKVSEALYDTAEELSDAVSPEAKALSAARALHGAALAARVTAAGLSAGAEKLLEAVKAQRARLPADAVLAAEDLRSWARVIETGLDAYVELTEKISARAAAPPPGA